MRMLAHLPTYDLKKIAEIEANCRRQLATGTERQRQQATTAIEAIEAERERRKLEAPADTGTPAGEPRPGLFDRVIKAFSEVPPDQDEIELLRTVAAHPGETFASFADRLKLGAVIRFSGPFGKMCARRKDQLGEPPMAVGGKAGVPTQNLICFTRVGKAAKRATDGAMFWPEASTALRQLRIIG